MYYYEYNWTTSGALDSATDFKFRFTYFVLDRALKLNLTRNGEALHEFVVPTCSYRMGVPEMAYGVLRIGIFVL